MATKIFTDAELEQLQHEAVRRLRYGFELDRRDFFKLMGGGLLVCLSWRAVTAQETREPVPRGGDDEPAALAAWLHVNEKGLVTVYTGKAELGQNIRTSLTQQVAEELHVPLSSIQLVMADTELTPYDRGTFGSRTTPYMGPQLRKAAAAARVVLIQMAAERWKADAGKLVASGGKVLDPQSKRSISYGELTKGQEFVKDIPADVPLASPNDWKIAGTPVPKLDARDFVTGRHKYTSDMTRPNLQYGKVLRPRAFHATLASLETADAQKIAGATVVRDGNFVGVVAPSVEVASRAVDALHAEWNAPKQISDRELYSYLRNSVGSEEDEGEQPSHRVGSINDGLAASTKTLAQTYTVAYIAHVPLEPRAAVAEWSADTLTVWTGTQRPFAVQEELAETFHLPIEKVRVIVPDTGSAYGGKHTGDAAVEAARLAKAAGRPVKLVWTREEEFTWAYFRPAGVIDAKAGVRADGTILTWEFDNYNSGPAGIRTPYNVPNQRIEFHPADSPLRQGSYRALAATANFFARESFMDELAHAMAMDPLELRLKNTTDARLRAVLETAAKNFGWGKEKSSPRRGFGIAAGTEKGSYVGTCVEVAIEGENVTIKRVVEAFECGAVVNPNGLQNQINGAIVQGMGGALFEAIHFDNGIILNPHLAQYRVPRFKDVPQIEIEVLDRKDLPPAGAGETPILGISPATANAIFAATGVRLRAMPLVPNGLKSSS